MTSEQIYEYIKEFVNKPINSLYLWGDEDDQSYEEIINCLIEQNNNEIDDWVWNALDIKEEDYRIENSSLNEKAKELVKNYLDTMNRWLGMSSIFYRKNITGNVLKNINDEIEGQRIILRPCSIKNNFDLYLKHAKEDGDFDLYVTPEKKNMGVEGLWFNTALPFSFYIILKDTDEEIGLVSLYDTKLNHNSVLKVANAHYYLYKEYRHHGYVYEAMSLLIDAFFSKRLKNHVTTDRKFIVEVKYCEPLCIKIQTNSNNESSNALAKKLGFIFEGTNHYYKFMNDVPQHENNYYLDIEEYSNLHKYN